MDYKKELESGISRFVRMKGKKAYEFLGKVGVNVDISNVNKSDIKTYWISMEGHVGLEICFDALLRKALKDNKCISNFITGDEYTTCDTFQVPFKIKTIEDYTIVTLNYLECSHS